MALVGLQTEIRVPREVGDVDVEHAVLQGDEREVDELQGRPHDAVCRETAGGRGHKRGGRRPPPPRPALPAMYVCAYTRSVCSTVWSQMCAHVTDSVFAFSSRSRARTRSMDSAVAAPPSSKPPPPPAAAAAASLLAPPLRRDSSSRSRPAARRAADARCFERRTCEGAAGASQAWGREYTRGCMSLRSAAPPRRRCRARGSPQ